MHNILLTKSYLELYIPCNIIYLKVVNYNKKQMAYYVIGSDFHGKVRNI